MGYVRVFVDECDMGGAVGLAIDNGLIGKAKQRLGVRISPREAADLARRILSLPNVERLGQQGSSSPLSSPAGNKIAPAGNQV